MDHEEMPELPPGRMLDMCPVCQQELLDNISVSTATSVITSLGLLCVLERDLAEKLKDVEQVVRQHYAAMGVTLCPML